MPKSHIFTCPWLLISTLDGFTSAAIEPRRHVSTAPQVRVALRPPTPTSVDDLQVAVQMLQRFHDLEQNRGAA